MLPFHELVSTKTIQRNFLDQLQFTVIIETHIFAVRVLHFHPIPSEPDVRSTTIL